MSPLTRKTGLKRTPGEAPRGPKRTGIASGKLRRVWVGARAKVEAEGRCRACGHPGNYDWPLEAAHTISRAAQDAWVSKSVKVVLASSVIPLDRRCHRLYDERRISLLGLLTFAELRDAVTASRRSRIDARRRLGGAPSGNFGSPPAATASRNAGRMRLHNALGGAVVRGMYVEAFGP